jgi:tRNA pseudouridine55 synthase
VSALRRYKVGAFEEAGMVTLDELEQDADAEQDRLDARLTPIDAALTHWPAVELNGDSAYNLRRGQAVFVAGATETGRLRIYGPNRSFLGLGAMDSSGKVAPKRLIRAK